MKIRITADSTCDLSPEYLAAHDVTIIPLTVTMGDRDYTDGVDIAPDDIFRHPKHERTQAFLKKIIAAGHRV